ncbi:peptidoglycan-binding domain 1 protein [Salinisphaera sp. PC39]|uniref:ExeA family protein n=1 Tax=Salinisphaera sp. PC39 TaxID=1304156 RepID=UPI0033428962
MYLRYFGFQDHPFSITPDPAFLYLSAHHREALGHLLYGTGEHGGFVQLTGEVGTGKTTLIRALLSQDIEDVDVALCLNPRLTVTEFVAAICDELGVDYPREPEPTLKSLVDALNAHLLEAHAAGRRTVVVLDEAQNLSRDVLEQVRLLTNLETHKHKLLRIILVGQPELADLLQRPDLRQLAQRITARYHLCSLNRRETRSYITHRLERVGGGPHVFTPAACAAVYRCTGGVPRLINIVCERALMGAYSEGRRRVGWRTVRRAAHETLPRYGGGEPRQWRDAVMPAAVLLGATALALALHYGVRGGADMTGLFAGVGDNIDDAVATADAGDAASSAAEGGNAGGTGDKREAAGSGDGTSPARSGGGDAAAKSAPAADVDSLALPGGSAGLDQLLRLWGVFGSAVNSDCGNLAVGDLRCFSARGGFDDLALYDRPALLTLREGRHRRRVLLSRLDDATATLVFPQGTRDVPRSRLAELWTGEFQVVWRRAAAPSYAGVGTVGQSVSWLRRRLALARGENPDARVGQPSPVFDETLEAELRRFQLTNGLDPDGMLGPRTMIVLENLTPTPGTPRLTGTGGG